MARGMIFLESLEQLLSYLKEHPEVTELSLEYENGDKDKVDLSEISDLRTGINWAEVDEVEIELADGSKLAFGAEDDEEDEDEEESDEDEEDDEDDDEEVTVSAVSDEEEDDDDDDEEDDEDEDDDDDDDDDDEEEEA
jgi:hypothetical protein